MSTRPSAATPKAPSGRVSERPVGYDDAIVGDRLTTFLYLLMRDHLPAGTVEGLMTDVEASGDDEVRLSNDFLGAYACELSLRLSGFEPADALRRAQLEVPRTPPPGG